jgi:tetratricopeptide (TPR) repeat protein
MKVAFIYLICSMVAIYSFFLLNQDIIQAHTATRYYQASNHEQAALHYLEAVRKGYRDPEGLIRFVDSLKQSQLLQNNAALCRELLDGDTMSADTLFALAGAFEAIQNWEMAIAAYDQIIHAGMATDSILLRRSRVAGYSGNWADAITHLRQLLKEDS